MLPGASQTRLTTRNTLTRYESGAFITTTEVANEQTAQVDYAFGIVRVVDAASRLVGYGYVTTNPIPPGGGQLRDTRAGTSWSALGVPRPVGPSYPTRALQK